MATITKQVLLLPLLLFSFATVKGQTEWVNIYGVKWATCNVDAPGVFAKKPSDLGKFYQWNRRVPLSSEVNDGALDTTYNGSNIWEDANNVCPAGWRLPNKTEMMSLIASGSFAGELDGVPGTFFAGKDTGNKDKLLFLPYGTRASNGNFYLSKTTYGNIWIQADENKDKEVASYNMGYNDGVCTSAKNNNPQKDRRNMGFFVRCVKNDK